MELKLTDVVVERPTKTVYKENDKIVKLFVENYLASNILNEALNHARVQEGTDLNVPKLLEVSKVNNRWAIVMERVEGKTLEQLMAENPQKENEYLNLFVDIQLNILSKNVPLLNRIKDKFKRKLTNAKNIDEHTKYELLHRLEGMKDHTKLCHGDLNPSNIIIAPNGDYHIIDWAHVTQGNASADVARTYLLFSMQGKTELADKYLNLFVEKSGIEKSNIQNWIPIVAGTQLTKGISEEQEFLKKWINIFDYQ